MAEQVQFCVVECNEGPIFNCLAVSDNDAIEFYRDGLGFTNVRPLAVFETDRGIVDHITASAERAILKIRAGK